MSEDNDVFEGKLWVGRLQSIIEFKQKQFG